MLSEIRRNRVHVFIFSVGFSDCLHLLQIEEEALELLQHACTMA